MVTPNNTYKVFFETIQMDEYADIDGTVIVQETSTYTVPDQIRLRVLNEASEVVYFQFVDMTGVPLSNAAMVYVKDIILNILKSYRNFIKSVNKISDPPPVQIRYVFISDKS